MGYWVTSQTGDCSRGINSNSDKSERHGPPFDGLPAEKYQSPQAKRPTGLIASHSAGKPGARLSLTDERGSFVADPPNGVSRFDRGVEVQLHAEVASSLNPTVWHMYIDLFD